MFASMSSSIEYVRAGKLRALAITNATRSPVLPDLPTVAEFLPPEKWGKVVKFAGLKAD